MHVDVDGFAYNHLRAVVRHGAGIAFQVDEYGSQVHDLDVDGVGRDIFFLCEVDFGLTRFTCGFEQSGVVDGTHTVGREPPFLCPLCDRPSVFEEETFELAFLSLDDLKLRDADIVQVIVLGHVVWVGSRDADS